MKYKHDRMLPADAFKVRGSVVGGRVMRLHGDSDDWWSQPEQPQEDGYYTGSGYGESDQQSYFVPYQQPVDPITEPAAISTIAAPVAIPPLTAAAQTPESYYIDTVMTGGGGGSEPTYETVLVTPDGNIAVTQDQSGQYVANVPGMANSDVTGAGSAATTGAPIDISALADINKAASEKAFGTGFGPAAGYAYSLKNSEGNEYQRYDAQGNLTEYLDTDGQWQKASNVKPTGTVFNPQTGGFETLYSVNDSQGVIGEWVPGMSVYHEDQGGFLGEGGWSRLAGLAAAGLSAGVAGGAFAGLGIGTAPGALTATQAASLMGVPAGISTGAVATAAVQGALIGAATSGLQGASPADMLKSSLIGGIAAGGGSLISGAGLGTVGNIAARTGLQTGLTAVAGGDVEQAAISGLINSVLPVALAESLPADTMSAFNSLPEPIKKIVMSTAGNVLNAGFNGQDISDAATSGVINGVINLGKDYARGAFNDLKESDLAQTIKGYFNQGSTAGDFTGESESPDVVDSIFRQDADEVMSRNAPPLVQDTINRNTPVTAETVTTPPLIQTAMNQTNPDDVYRELVAAFENPYIGTPSGALASATTSDVNPVAVNQDAEVVTTLPTTTVYANEDQPTNAGGFLGEYRDLAPVIDRSIPQVDTSGNLIRFDQDYTPPSTLTQLGQGLVSAFDNTVGAVLPTIVQNAAYLGLRTADQVAKFAASIIGQDYKADPDAMREISTSIGNFLGNPLGKASDVIASQFTGEKDSVTGSLAYEREASGRLLRFVDANLEKGAEYISEATGLPVGDVRFLADIVMARPGAAANLVGEARTTARDIGQGYTDAATGIISESPTAAYNTGATIADITRGADTSLYRGDSTIKRVDTGDVVNDSTSTFVSPEKLTGPTRAIEYANRDYGGDLDSTATVIDSPSRSAFNVDAFDDAMARVDSPSRSAEVATQLAPETRGALPTTYAEPTTIKPIDLDLRVDANTVAKITIEAEALDRNLRNLDDPRVQEQANTFVRNTYEAVTKEPISPTTAAIFNTMFYGGATSSDVATAITSAANNPSASAEVVADQAKNVVVDSEEFRPLTLPQQTVVLSNIINNSSDLGVTPEDAIKIGLINNDGTKTDLGEMVAANESVKPSTEPVTQSSLSVTLPPVTQPVDTTTASSTEPVKSESPLTNLPPLSPATQTGTTAPVTTPPVTVTTEEEEEKEKEKKKSLQPTGSAGMQRAIFYPPNPGALPGYLEGTYLKGVDVDAYDPFENYNTYQQIAPVNAAQGGSPLQLMQLQQGIVGGDPRQYSMVQPRQAPNYFTYGADTSSNTPTTFAGSQLTGKPRPNIPVTPTGNIGANDWLYGAAGSNQLSPAGASIPTLPSGLMAEGGMAHGGLDEGEHRPEFITGLTGHYVQGRGDGQSDDIPAMLADGEYVFDSSAVSTLGNGSSDAGAKLLDAFRETLREHTRSAPKDKIPPKASPLQYMQEAMKKVGMA